MNRKQRRELAKETKKPVAKDPVYYLKKSEIERIKKQAAEDAVDTAMTLLLAIPVKVLHDGYSWGTRKRLPEFGEKIIDEYQAFNDGEMTLQQYADLVFEYTGIKFERNKEY